MKSFRKIMALALAVLMCMTLFAACGGQSNEGGATADQSGAGEAASPNAEPSAEPSEAPAAGGEEGEDAESDLAYITDKGKLVIGVTVYEPMNYKDENDEWTGFDTEFAIAVCEKLGVTPEFLPIDWDNKIFELDAKGIDCVWNGMTLTDEVKNGMSTSQAYINNKQVVIMDADAVANYADVESMKELSFAAESGSAGEQAIADNGLDANYTAVPTQADALLEVSSGASDACVIDITMAAAMTGEGTSYADLGQGIALTSEEYGIGFRKGSDVTEKVDEIINELIADGTLQALAEKYELSAVLVANQQ